MIVFVVSGKGEGSHSEIFGVFKERGTAKELVEKLVVAQKSKGTWDYTWDFYEITEHEIQ